MLWNAEYFWCHECFRTGKISKWSFIVMENEHTSKLIRAPHLIAFLIAWRFVNRHSTVHTFRTSTPNSRFLPSPTGSLLLPHTTASCSHVQPIFFTSDLSTFVSWCVQCCTRFRSYSWSKMSILGSPRNGFIKKKYRHSLLVTRTNRVW